MDAAGLPPALRCRNRLGGFCGCGLRSPRETLVRTSGSRVTSPSVVGTAAAASACTAARADALATAQGGLLSPSFQLSAKGTSAGAKCVWDLAVLVLSDVDRRSAAAWLLACAIASQRGGNSAFYATWYAAALAGVPLGGKDRLRAEGFVAPVFGLPGRSPAPQEQLQGFITEWLWYCLAREKKESHRSLSYIESPSWSVTEQGGDGLALYSDVAGAGALSFRLWELKKHVSSKPISSTIGKAYAQLDDRALTYLAKITSASAHMTGDLGELLANLADRWLDADPAAGVGVGVATNSPAPSKCFTTMGRRFPRLSGVGQLEGLLACIEDLPGFTLDVRRFVWSAL